MALSDRELTALLQAEKAAALSGMEASKLAEDRERAMNYYNGDVSQDMPSVSDRSKAVSFDVSDTVEGLMPVLMEIFCAGDEVVKFQPVGEEDVEQAEQETAYINHVYMQKNPGFINTYSFVKDALLQKNGVVKVFWDVEEREEKETFLDQPDDVFALVSSDPNVEVVEHTAHPAPYDPMQGAQDPAASLQPQPPPVLHDFTIVQKTKYGCCKVVPVPPEEFGVSRRAKMGQPFDYSYHAVRKTQADLIAQGYDPDQVKDLPAAAPDQTSESIARDTINESQAGKDNINKANREILVTEHYCMVNYEESGKAKLYRITTAGEAETKILNRKVDGKDTFKPDIVEVEFDPFAAITPFIVTHRFFGRSVADLVIEIQRIKTSLLRALLDNAYLANNQRLEVAESNAHPKTLDDILDNRIGGVVRTARPGGLLPIPNQPIGEFVFPTIEYMDSVREWRTGVTRQGQGLDPDALQNIGQDAVIRAQNAAMEKTRLIARIFAETGFKDLFWKIHATVRKNESGQPTFLLENKWVTVDPREWKRRDNLVATVGLGTGSRGEQMAFWQSVMVAQKEAMLGGLTQIVTPQNIYNSQKRYMELGGERAVDRYWTNPKDQPPAPPPPDPKMVEAQGKLQIAAQKTQGDQALAQQKQQSDQVTTAAKLKGDMMAALQKADLERQQMMAKFQLEREQMAAEFELRAQQLERELELKREEIYVGAAVDAHVAKVKADSQPVRMGGKPG